MTSRVIKMEKLASEMDANKVIRNVEQREPGWRSAWVERGTFHKSASVEYTGSGGLYGGC
jgi:hypothetical protein